MFSQFYPKIDEIVVSHRQTRQRGEVVLGLADNGAIPSGIIVLFDQVSVSVGATTIRLDQLTTSRIAVLPFPVIALIKVSNPCIVVWFKGARRLG